MLPIVFVNDIDLDIIAQYATLWFCMLWLYNGNNHPL